MLIFSVSVSQPSGCPSDSGGQGMGCTSVTLASGDRNLSQSLQVPGQAGPCSLREREMEIEGNGEGVGRGWGGGGEGVGRWPNW